MAGDGPVFDSSKVEWVKKHFNTAVKEETKEETNELERQGSELSSKERLGSSAPEENNEFSDGVDNLRRDEVKKHVDEVKKHIDEEKKHNLTSVTIFSLTIARSSDV